MDGENSMSNPAPRSRFSTICSTCGRTLRWYHILLTEECPSCAAKLQPSRGFRRVIAVVYRCVQAGVFLLIMGPLFPWLLTVPPASRFLILFGWCALPEAVEAFGPGFARLIQLLCGQELTVKAAGVPPEKRAGPVSLLLEIVMAGMFLLGHLLRVAFGAAVGAVAIMLVLFILSWFMGSNHFPHAN